MLREISEGEWELVLKEREKELLWGKIADLQKKEVALRHELRENRREQENLLKLIGDNS